MKEVAFRLHKGDDLKKALLLKSKDFNTAVVLSSVGCLNELHLRLAGAKDTLSLKEDFEILSLNGTISSGKVHLHLSVSDKKGNCYGGHLLEGCIVNTTCEVVLGILEEYTSYRQMDSSTGYDEIAFQKKA